MDDRVLILIGILVFGIIAVLTLAVSSCTKEDIREQPLTIEGYWKLSHSYSDTNTVYYQDLEGIRITENRFYDCYFICQSSPTHYAYDYQGEDMNVSEGLYLFKANLKADCLIFTHDNGFKNVFVRYTEQEIGLSGCF